MYALRITVAMLVVPFYIMVGLTIKRLCMRGTSSNLRKMVAKRHLIYIVFFTLKMVQFGLDQADIEIYDFEKYFDEDAP